MKITKDEGWKMMDEGHMIKGWVTEDEDGELRIRVASNFFLFYFNKMLLYLIY